MVAIDDGFADARASQISLMNKFTVVYENSAIKNLPDFGISFPFIWNGVKKWITNGDKQEKELIDGQSSRNEEFESKRIAYSKMNLNWVTRLE